MSSVTRERRGKPVTHEQALKSAQRLINSHFHNDNRARMSIPVDYDDDDCTIVDYIMEQKERGPDTECESCSIGPKGHEYDCPEAQV